MSGPRDTDADWARVAGSDPYWAVLSNEAFRGTTLDEANRARFFASGETAVANLLGFIRRHLDAEFEPGRVLDFGCGVGRLLVPLARRARQAVGVDVAPAMLELCRANLDAAGLTHAELLLGSDGMEQPQGPFDLVNSLIVLQHVPPERGYRLIRRLVQLAAIGGVVSLQLTYARERRHFGNEARRARWYRRDGAALHDLDPEDETAPVGAIRMYDYDLNQVMLTLAAAAGHPMLVLPTNDDGHAGSHFVFRRAR